MLRFHRPIAALGPLRFIASALYLQTPLRQSCVVIGLQLFDGKPHGFDSSRCDGLEKSVSNGPLDRHAGNVETVHAAPIDEIFPGAVITGSCITAAIMDVQTAPTVSAGCKPLQQCRALSHRSSRLMR